MAYVAVTGGQEAIEEANGLAHFYRVKDTTPSLDIESIEKQLRLLVDRVMGEGGMYAPEYAALALKQAEGDPAEAAFLLRAYRSTLPRNHYSLTVQPVDMRVIRRISSSFRDIPGGQMLGPTYDYTHRMLNFSLRQESNEDMIAFAKEYTDAAELADGSLTFKKVADLLREQGLMAKAAKGKSEEQEPFDITRQKMTIPTTRAARLQALTRGETGAMTALAYSSMRGYGVVHPTIGELRVGYAPVYIPYPYSSEGGDDCLYIGELMLTEVETINSFKQDAESGNVQFLLGYGLCFGQNELKGISMAILERSLETEGTAPAQDEEFVLTHIDSVESSGFVSHLKLPHYITFQSSLDQIRKVQVQKAQLKPEEDERDANNRAEAEQPQENIQHSRV
ncbi:carbon-phosphorus lyase complex subunit PhnI [Paenibacillus prosopidis]|uniref:Alpha-D-ribose 1-methylphosphonate 5-triphosphate synthase subunit PhnI n=1 Tax=Paenibacillus prosopidis TaxID=630520 RepID=A0A368W7U9_9BACL|nr:carbon-phosphorus lyase complex subunit PhnI [Paenibacillus prosopidis]RCW51725.1 alpha-D-ribose 1-methylphosphonate 5-triphosphate synthase subunit PhnI [Paenibacillus prosopidis]